MVITQVQFNKAMEEINVSYAKLVKRIEELERKLAEHEKECADKPAAKK